MKADEAGYSDIHISNHLSVPRFHKIESYLNGEEILDSPAAAKLEEMSPSEKLGLSGQAVRRLPTPVLPLPPVRREANGEAHKPESESKLHATDGKESQTPATLSNAAEMSATLKHPRREVIKRVHGTSGPTGPRNNRVQNRLIGRLNPPQQSATSPPHFEVRSEKQSSTSSHTTEGLQNPWDWAAPFDSLLERSNCCLTPPRYT